MVVVEDKSRQGDVKGMWVELKNPADSVVQSKFEFPGVADVFGK